MGQPLGGCWGPSSSFALCPCRLAKPRWCCTSRRTSGSSREQPHTALAFPLDTSTGLSPSEDNSQHPAISRKRMEARVLSAAGGCQHVLMCPTTRFRACSTPMVNPHPPVASTILQLVTSHYPKAAAHIQQLHLGKATWRCRGWGPAAAPNCSEPMPCTGRPPRAAKLLQAKGRGDPPRELGSPWGCWEWQRNDPGAVVRSLLEGKQFS